MSIDARISTVTKYSTGLVVISLAPYKASDGTMSIPGVEKLQIADCKCPPHSGQKIWGNSGRCILEASNGGPRIEYRREGRTLYEDQP